MQNCIWGFCLGMGRFGADVRRRCVGVTVMAIADSVPADLAPDFRALSNVLQLTKLYW